MKENMGQIIKRLRKERNLTQEELERIKEKREREIALSLSKLNNDIYQNEKGLGVERVKEEEDGR